ncbi:hypothetical protein M3P36_14475 [Altererythrobacter sp. KTW20L]|uniref:hypothetical protein n=1 Tax=Altererythrobacter sp. KTW20L TaxID=2942210 RepID=UPI0020BD7AF5|nr:hypothetical protein [Altererythrobacter sp. KTW20L]MCL6252247.1 hypothetical protein [Altererythrobacter sp. KTW20L]
MRGILDFLVQLILAIFGALGMAIAMAAGAVLLGGCAVLGTGWCWRAWRGRQPPP